MASSPIAGPVLRIGTRKSALARWQAGRVQKLLAARGMSAELVPLHTAGDEGAGPPRAGFAVKGLFTKEIEEALLAGRIELAVHSLKDLAITLPLGLVLAAVPEREDPRDALVTRDGRVLEDLPPGARVGSSSLRRRAAVMAIRPDLTLVSLRGNVPTRVRRVDEGAVDAAVLALAGLTRLGLAGRAVPLDPQVVVPAPGQGALAVEARADDARTLECVAGLDDPDLRAAAEAERAALGALGTGCNVPIGAICTRSGGRLTLLVAVYAVDGAAPVRVVVPVEPGDPGASGRAAARELLARGAGELIAQARERAAHDAEGSAT